MAISSFTSPTHKCSPQREIWDRQRILHLFALFLLASLTMVSIPPVHAQGLIPTQTMEHTQATVDTGCTHVTFSSDGNPFPMCPGPLPKGGNCVWWAWEMWHLLGYNLPNNWGNPADWIVDAERTGLPMSTLPQVGALAVFPIADGVWAFTPAGHVAFVTRVSANGQNFGLSTRLSVLGCLRMETGRLGLENTYDAA